MKKNIFELKINNKDKDFENYLRPQWSWKTLVTIGIFCFVLIFVVNDLEIDFVKLVTDSSKYFGDILSRMLPPDFSNLNQLIYAMFETIEIAFLGTFIAIVLSIPLGLFSARNLAPNYFVYLICKTIVIFFRAIPVPRTTALSGSSPTYTGLIHLATNSSGSGSSPTKLILVK